MRIYAVYVIPGFSKDISNNLKINIDELTDLRNEALFANLHCNNIILICVHHFPRFSPDA